MHEELLKESPELTDEGFEAQWEMMESLGLLEDAQHPVDYGGKR